MDQRQAFLSDICEHPDDDAPRLVFADWLSDHGEADRAEFIRVQIELAKLAEDDPRRPALSRREEELWEAHEDRWRAESPHLARLPELHLGACEVGDEGALAL